MKINLTKKEYRLLIEMLYLSDWVMHSHQAELRYTEHEAIKNKILSLYKEMDAEEILEYSSDLGEVFEKDEFDAYLQEKFIAPFEEQVFWEALIDELGERDVIKALGIDAYRMLDGFERVRKVENYKELYANEFQQHGLENVKIDYKDRVKN